MGKLTNQLPLIKIFQTFPCQSFVLNGAMLCVGSSVHVLCEQYDFHVT